MTVIIAGSRGLASLDQVMDVIDRSPFAFTRVISGCAPGVDSFALMKPWACEVVKMPADWQRYGLSAGYRRNYEMARAAQALIAIWDGKSRGTKNMVMVMESMGKPVEVVRVG